MDSNDNKKSKTRSSSKSDAKAENPHQGHRRRLREQFLRNGLESMYPHQALELLLFLFNTSNGYKRVGTRAYKEIRKLGGSV